jgi:hypothetical protein
MKGHATGYRRRTMPPPAPVRIDRTHPLAQGLVGCWLLADYGSGTLFDSATGMTQTLHAGAGWGARGFQTTTAGAGSRQATPLALQLSYPLTVVWRGYQIGPTSPGGGLICCRPHDGSTAPTACYQLGWNATDNKLEFWTNDGTNLVGIEANSGTALDAPAVGTEYQVAATISGRNPSTGVETITLYNGGTTIGSGTMSAAGPIAYGTDTVLGLGEPTVGVYTANPNVAHHLALVYGYALGPAALAWLWQQPYAFLLPPASSVYAMTGLAHARRTLSGRAGARGMS